MAKRFNQVEPFRVGIDIKERSPKISSVEDSPIVYIRLAMDLRPVTVIKHAHVLYMEAEVQVHPDRSFDLLWLEPQYEILPGSSKKGVLAVYYDVLEKAIEESNLSLLGVQ